MDVAIITSIISALVTIFTVILNSKATENKITAELKINQAVTDERINNLIEEVRKHNTFAQKIPVLEEQIKVANTRIDRLENREHDAYN